MKLDDKNILIIKNGDHSLISIDGSILKYNKKEIKYFKKRNITLIGKKRIERAYELLTINNEKLYYNNNTGFWSKQKEVIK